MISIWIITKIVQDNTTVGAVIEGGYLARAFLLGQMNSNYLNLLAQKSKTDLHLLTIKVKFWNKQKVISALPSSFHYKQKVISAFSNNQRSRKRSSALIHSSSIVGIRS